MKIVKLHMKKEAYIVSPGLQLGHIPEVSRRKLEFLLLLFMTLVSCQYIYGPDSLEIERIT